MRSYTVRSESAASPEDVARVVQGLVRFNDARAEPERFASVTLFARDASGALRGGLLGSTQWEWLYVSHLWVDEGMRGLGCGRELLLRAEAEAIDRGCRHAHLDTFGFQALGFYERLGYERFGALEDYPPGETRYFLQKPLLPEPAP